MTQTASITLSNGHDVKSQVGDLRNWQLKLLRTCICEEMRSRTSGYQKLRPFDLEKSFTLEDWEKFDSSVKIPLARATFLWLLFTGCRPSALEHTELVRSRDAVEIFEPKTKRKKLLPLYTPLRFLAPHLSAIKRYSHSKAYLRKRFNKVRSRFPEFCYVYGVTNPQPGHPEGQKKYQYSLYTFRHTFTQVLHEAGIDAYRRALLRGDEPTSVVGIQAHYMVYRLRDKLADLERAFFPWFDSLKRRGLAIWLDEVKK